MREYGQALKGRISRRLGLPLWLLAAVVGLAGCQSFGGAPAGSQGTAAAVGVNPAGSGGSGAVKAGLLLPLTGTGASLGRAMLDAAQLAVFEYADPRLELLPRDTKGTPAGARAAAEAATRAGAKVILGPLLSAEANGVKPAAHAAGVPMISFTNDERLADAETFVFGLGPGEQVSRVISYAASRGYRRFAILAPQGAYGDVVAAAAVATVARTGGLVVRAERYAPTTADVGAAVRRLTGARAERVGADGQPLPAAEPAVLDFEALVLAEGGEGARSLVRSLTNAGVDFGRLRLLGTGLWDDPALANEPSLAGAWFAAPPPGPRRRFEAQFQSAFQQPAPRLATLAYDAVAIAGTLVQRQGNQAFTVRALTDPQGFPGVDGPVRLLPTGRAERGLAVLEFAPGGPTEIDRAPAGFAPLAF